MKVLLERPKCIGCGSCVGLCPKHFEMEEDGKGQLKNSTRNPKTGNCTLEVKKVECIQEAADACPVQIIHILKN